jgi:hypothetical protein
VPDAKFQLLLTQEPPFTDSLFSDSGSPFSFGMDDYAAASNCGCRVSVIVTTTLIVIYQGIAIVFIPDLYAE